MSEAWPQNSINVLNLKIGSSIQHNNQLYVITNLIDINNILARSCVTGKIERLRIVELSSQDTPTTDTPIKAPSAGITDEDWKEAMHRFEIILPLIASGVQRDRSLVEQRAIQFKVSASAIYRWIALYKSTGVVSSLVRKSRSDKGLTRISKEVESIIQSCIKELYLTKQRYKISTVTENVIMRCKQAGLQAPHVNTIRTRIANISDEEVLLRRRSSKEAKHRFAPIKGSFPGAEYPLAVVQIDHTPLDVVVVDEITRTPIGRPWITLAFDVFSRMVCGFYIAMEKPSTMSVALCIAHSILPKERWLTNRDISLSWPVWGIPDSFHLDNAREFRGNSIKRSCDEYGITINWRPVARPHYGGHIERMLGTLGKTLHEVPGATFSNPKERGYYDSDAKAVLTLQELESWITTYILGRYHQQIHSELGMKPADKYEEGILGKNNIPGRGLPPRIQEESRVLLDFMPYTERTIQNYGVVFEHVHYYSNILRKWIHAKSPDNSKLKRKFIFKYDPRDISKLFFLDPEMNMYFPIPYQNTARPAISIWELREAESNASKQSHLSLDEDSLFRSYQKLREIEQEATRQTKKMRRLGQQKRDLMSRSDYKPSITALNPPPSESLVLASTQIKEFEDIDEDI